MNRSVSERGPGRHIAPSSQLSSGSSLNVAAASAQSARCSQRQRRSCSSRSTSSTAECKVAASSSRIAGKDEASCVTTSKSMPASPRGMGYSTSSPARAPPPPAQQVVSPPLPPPMAAAASRRGTCAHCGKQCGATCSAHDDSARGERLTHSSSSTADTAASLEVLASEDSVRLRKAVKLYPLGAFVEVWSAVHQQWMLDGEVTSFCRETHRASGLRIIAGSLEVAYAKGRKFVWLAPQFVETHLRRSQQPEAPPPKAGKLCAFGLMWYFELSKGFLRWWDNEECAMCGEAADGVVHLLDLQHRTAGQEIELRASATQGEVFMIEGANEEEAESWDRALGAHADYCRMARAYQSGRDVPKTRTRSRMSRSEFGSTGSRASGDPAQQQPRPSSAATATEAPAASVTSVARSSSGAARSSSGAAKGSKQLAVAGGVRDLSLAGGA